MWKTTFLKDLHQYDASEISRNFFLWKGQCSTMDHFGRDLGCGGWDDVLVPGVSGFKQILLRCDRFSGAREVGQRLTARPSFLWGNLQKSKHIMELHHGHKFVQRKKKMKLKISLENFFSFNFFQLQTFFSFSIYFYFEQRFWPQFSSIKILKKLRYSCTLDQGCPNCATGDICGPGADFLWPPAADQE